MVKVPLKSVSEICWYGLKIGFLFLFTLFFILVWSYLVFFIIMLCPYWLSYQLIFVFTPSPLFVQISLVRFFTGAHFQKVKIAMPE